MIQLKTLGKAAGVLLLVYACDRITDRSVEDYKEVFTWPASVVENGYRYCDLRTYRTCSKNQWFGVVRDTETDKNDLVVRHAIGKLIDTACQSRSETPQSHQMRIIELNTKQNLVLCRLKEPKEIDRGKMLMYAERARFIGL